MIANNSLKFKEYLKSFSSREFVKLECPQCHKLFAKIKHDIQSKLGKYNNRKTICCSRVCQYQTLNKSQNLLCLQCGIEFIKKANQIKKTTKNFCSSSCFGIYQNAHKTTGTRRSKLEKWLEEQLLCLYSNIKFEFNKIKEIGAELDINIPSLKLAFELDGIFHYKPIFGEEKFLATQKNDLKKIKSCSDKGIQLIKIDVSSMKKFSIKESEKYLQIIRQKIDNNRLI